MRARAVHSVANCWENSVFINLRQVGNGITVCFFFFLKYSGGFGSYPDRCRTL